MRVPFLAVGKAYEELAVSVDAAYRRVMLSGRYVLGDEVAALEEEFARFCDASFCVGVGTGLDALLLALEALEVGPGDEVIVPAHTFIATWLAVSRVGARPIPVEPDASTYNIDPGRIAAALTPRTRAIVPVHLYGQPVDLEPILRLAASHGLHVIEDCAQAHGARYRQRPVGSQGTVGAWSFYPAKNLGAFGDGGAITTNDRSLAERLRMLRNYGSRSKHEHEIRGVNSRLDELQAAFLRERLAVLEDWNQRRRRLATLYLDELPAVAGLELPAIPRWADPVWHLFVVRHPRRDALAHWLRRRGIETLVHYPAPPHLTAAYADLKLAAGSLPKSEKLCEEVLSLPLGPHLSPVDVRYVIDSLLQFRS